MKKIFLTALLASWFATLCPHSDAKINPSQMDKTKEFSLLVRVPVSYTTEQALAVGPKWDTLLREWKEEKRYILSFAFPGESRVITEGKEVKTLPVVSDNLRVVSNIVLRCKDLQEALEQARRCPVLAHDGSVEVREIPKGVTYADR